MKNLFACECGKQFTEIQSFRGHKANCPVHMKVCGKYDNWMKSKKLQLDKSAATSKKNAAKRREENLAKWVSEEHMCKKCGKIMTEKWGNGIFCSRNCANSHIHSEETKHKISTSLKQSHPGGTHKQRNENLKQEYYKTPSICQICGAKLPYDKRNNMVCCKKCQNVLQSQLAIKRCAEQGTNLCGKGLRGYYKGYYCQSSWELAYVIYCLEHDIPIERNKERFGYVFDNKEHSYFPDFYLPETKEYVEVKGYYDAKTKAKELQFPKDKKLVLKGKNEMGPILKYVRGKYGKNYTLLYDKKVV